MERKTNHSAKNKKQNPGRQHTRYIPEKEKRRKMRENKKENRKGGE